MDAISTETALLQGQSWDDIFSEVNAWRGACMHHFSTVEMAITETSLALSMVTAGGEKIRLRHLIGQRFEDLAAAVGPGGPFAEAGKNAFPELAQYRERHEAFRSLLCHGVVNVSVDHSGQWILLIRSLAIRARHAERNILVLEQPEASAKLAALKRDGQKLASILGQLRKTMNAA